MAREFESKMCSDKEETEAGDKLFKSKRRISFDEGPLHVDEDCNWAWVIFGAVFIGRVIVLGTLLTFGIYFAYYLQVFKAPRSVTSLIGSIMWFFYDLSGVINAVFVHRFGPRMSVIAGSLLLTFSFLLSTSATNIFHLLVTQGILLGVGSNLINLAFVISLKLYFRKYKNLTQGVSTSGAGIGVFIMGLVVPKIMDTYGLRGTFILHGGLILHLCIIGAVIFPIRPLPSFYLSNVASMDDKTTGSWISGFSILCSTKRFWLLVLSYLSFNFSYVSSILLFKDFVTVRGLETHFAVALVAFGGGDICGRLASGILSSWSRINPVLLFSCINALCGCLILLNMTVVYTGTALLCVSFMFGFGSGCANGLFFVVPCHLYSSGIFLVAFASCSAFGGLGSIISTPVAGFIIDRTQSYFGALAMASSFSFTAALLLFLLFYSDRKSNVDSNYNYTDIRIKSSSVA